MLLLAAWGTFISLRFWRGGGGGGVSGGFRPCRHLRPSSGREHTIVQLIQSGDDDYLMNETRRKPTTGRQSPSLSDKWHGIFYMPSRIDEAGHTKAFEYPVAEHWGESRNVQFRRWDSNQHHIGPESNVLPTEPPRFPPFPSVIQLYLLIGNGGFRLMIVNGWFIL